MTHNLFARSHSTRSAVGVAAMFAQVYCVQVLFEYMLAVVASCVFDYMEPNRVTLRMIANDASGDIDIGNVSSTFSC